MSTGYYNNKMYGKVTVYGVNSASLPSFIWPKIHKDITSQIKTRRQDQEDLQGTIAIPFTYYIPSSLNVFYSSDLHCSIKIKPNNRMHGIVEVVPPHEYTDISIPIQDSFVRSHYSRLNYGDKVELYAGRLGSGDTFRTYLKFNIVDIESFYKIKFAKLVLNTGLFNSSHTLGLYKVTEDWTETGITWKNQPEAGELITVFSTTSPVTEINILDYIKQWQQNREPVNLCIMAINEETGELSTFASRETQTPPQLIIKYTDPTELWYFNNYQLPSIINVVGVNKKDLPSSLEVPNYNMTEDLPSSIDVKYPYILPGELTVSKVNWPGQIWPIVHKDIGCSVEVRWGAPHDMESSINVNRKEISSTISIPCRHDVPGDIKVRGFESKDMISVIFVNRRDMPGTIHPIIHFDVPSEIAARRSSVLEYPGWIAVNHKELPGVIWPIEYRNINSQITVRRTWRANLTCSLIVRRPGTDDTPSRISIFWNRDTESSLKVRKADTNDLAGWLGITRKDLPALIKIVYSDDLDSSIGVRIKAKADLPSVLKSRRDGLEDMPSQLYIFYSDDLTSQIKVRREGNFDVVSWLGASRKDINGIIWPRIHFDIPGIISCRTYGDSNLNSNIKVRQIGISDLRVDFLLRQFNASDLQSRLELETKYIPYAFIM